MADGLITFGYPGRDAPGGRSREGHRGSSYQLVNNETTVSTVQVMAKGEQNTLHVHPGVDGYWYILGGRSRFHGTCETNIG
jgi:mannose-6-phosphate isomerase-like protein (cupin superfamily)